MPTTRERIIKFLEENSDKKFSQVEVGEELGLDIKRPTLSKHFKTLTEDLELVKKVEGKYAWHSYVEKGILKDLNQWLFSGTLNSDQIKKLRGLLTEEVKEALIEIGKAHPVELPDDLQPDPDEVNRGLDAWELIKGLWLYERQRELVEEGPIQKGLSELGRHLANLFGLKPGAMMDAVKKVKDLEVEGEADELLDFFKNEMHSLKLSNTRTLVGSVFPGRVGQEANPSGKKKVIAVGEDCEMRENCPFYQMAPGMEEETAVHN